MLRKSLVIFGGIVLLVGIAFLTASLYCMSPASALSSEEARTRLNGAVKLSSVIDVLGPPVYHEASANGSGSYYEWNLADGRAWGWYGVGPIKYGVFMTETEDFTKRWNRSVHRWLGLAW